MHLSGGQANDGPEGRVSLTAVGDRFTGVPVAMDRAYEGEATRAVAIANGHPPVVPPKSNRRNQWVYDKELYKGRNVVERLFRRIKEFRRICTRYDKLDTMYLAYIQFAFITIWLK
jgi:transposase